MKPGRISFGVLSVLLVLLLNLLAASPSLHEQFHPDAGQPGHHCAVTLFAHAHVDSTAMEVAAIVPVAPAHFLPTSDVSISSAWLKTLPPGRGPPVSLLPS